MKVELTRRHYGIHDLVKDAELPGQFSDYAIPVPGTTQDEYKIDEDKLLAALPEGFLPVPTRRVLLTVRDADWSTGQVGLTRFKSWAKYFDAYTLSLRSDSSGDAVAPNRVAST